MWTYNYSTELYHHGILGQKWGQRNGPPYPLDSKQMSSREKTAQTNSSKIATTEDNQSKRKLTDKQKKVIAISAAVVASGLAVYGGYKLYKVYGSSKIVDVGKKALVPSFPNLSLGAGINQSNGFYRFNREIDDDARIRLINPNLVNNPLHPLYDGTNYNCGNCVLAYEMQNRNFAVEAHMNEIGLAPEHLWGCFTNIRQNSIQSLKPEIDGNTVQHIKSKLLDSFPDGARGFMYLPLTDKYKEKELDHFTSWRIENGIVHIIDPQIPGLPIERIINDNYDNSNFGAKKYGILLTRTDDLDLNLDFCKNFVKNIGDRSESSFDPYFMYGQDFIAHIEKLLGSVFECL